MKTTAAIRKFIQGLQKQQIFVTREVLIHGSRSAVDQALHVLTRRGDIRRLARVVVVPVVDDLHILPAVPSPEPLERLGLADDRHDCRRSSTRSIFAPNARRRSSMRS